MTMIAAVRQKEILGTQVDKFLIAGDSRVVRQSSISGKYISHIDSAQKVIPVAPNVIIGLAGDYRYIDTIKKIRNQLNKINPITRLPIFMIFALGIINNCNNIIKQASKSFEDTDFLVAIYDYTTKSKKLYKICTLTGDYYELKDDGLYLIGCDSEERKNFRTTYNGFKKNFESQGKFFEMELPLLASFHEISSEYVGGIVSCYENKQGNWVSIGHADIHITDKTVLNSVADGSVGDKWNRQVNGKTICESTINFDEIDKKLNTHVSNI